MATFGVWLFRKATRNCPRLLDIPNERSSHSVPITRGAGVAIVAVVLGLYLYVFGSSANLAYVFAALAIAVASFLDDLFSLPIALRLTVHFAAASALVSWIGDLTPTNLPALGYTVFIVWVINAYNFMDGIDGIASVQGAATSLGWILFGITTGNDSIALIGSILLGACSGFIVFNWQPAKVFMGDVGSTFLGFTFAVFPLVQSKDQFTNGVSLVFVPTLLLWLFIFDTIYTRLGQVILLKPFWKAHRDHLYQRIVGAGSAHSLVAAFFGLFGVGVAVALATRSSIGSVPLVVLMFVGPACLVLWAGKKRLT